MECAADLSRMELTRGLHPTSGPSGSGERTAPEQSWTPLTSDFPRLPSPPSGPVGEVLAEDDQLERERDRTPTTPPREASLDTIRSRTPDRFAALPSPGPVGEWTPRSEPPLARAVSEDRPAASRLSFARLNSDRSPSPVENPRLSPFLLDQTATKATRDHALRAVSHSRTLLTELVEERNLLAELRHAFGRTLGMRAQTMARHWLEYNRMLVAESGNGEGDGGEVDRV